MLAPSPYQIRIIKSSAEMAEVEALQCLVWPGDDIEIVPVHMLRAVEHNGGLVIGVFADAQLVGFVFGFPGVKESPSGPKLFHASHMAGVHPDYRDVGLGFLLKRAQWQLVRQQKIDLITWTYDPLQSRNANLNISKLGAVCNTYIPDYYGEMRDGLNIGMPSDRFKVDWWVNSNRVTQKLSKKPPRKLDLAHYLSAETPFVNRSQINEAGLIEPIALELDLIAGAPTLLLLEIPADIHYLKTTDQSLAIAWSQHIRDLFSFYFSQNYFVTDFIYLPGSQPRSFYVMSHGEATF
jgi:predicted GNAT superfamily acetyltransferase